MLGVLPPGGDIGGDIREDEFQRRKAFLALGIDSCFDDWSRPTSTGSKFGNAENSRVNVFGERMILLVASSAGGAVERPGIG
jgi:hypothetical protein